MLDIQVGSAETMMRIKVRDPSIAIYRDIQYPDFYVARLFDSGKETNVIMVKSDLEEMKKDIQKHTDMVFYRRTGASHPDLVGVWY